MVCTVVTIVVALSALCLGAQSTMTCQIGQRICVQESSNYYYSATLTSIDTEENTVTAKWLDFAGSAIDRPYSTVTHQCTYPIPGRPFDDNPPGTPCDTGSNDECLFQQPLIPPGIACLVTQAPTTAPTAPVPPRYVSTAGVDSPDCGESLSNACATIQQAVEMVDPSGTVFVAAGVYNCGSTTSSYAANINKSISLRSEGALIDCKGFGAGLSIKGASHVLIEGFHFRNGNGICAGGICALEVLTPALCSLHRSLASAVAELS